jgi:hypothetical protein
MKLEVIKLSDGKYAIRKGWWTYEYADINDIESNSPIYWWGSLHNSSQFSTSNIQELLDFIEKNKKTKKPTLKVERVIANYEVRDDI